MQVRIDYKWREKDRGQHIRQWHGYYTIVNAESVEQAIVDFMESAVVDISITKAYQVSCG
jgi:hypothetical protein